MQYSKQRMGGTTYKVAVHAGSKSAPAKNFVIHAAGPKQARKLAVAEAGGEGFVAGHVTKVAA